MTPAIPSVATESPEPRQLALTLALLVALSPFSIDAYLPALPRMAEFYAADLQRVEDSISAYLLGFALGQLLGAPLSDQRGRRPAALLGLLVFIGATVLVLFTTTVEQMLWLRVIQAVGVGCAAVNAAAIVGDLFDEIQSARVYSMIMMITTVAPLIAPAIGAVLLQFFDWQSVFVFLAAYGAAVTVLIYRRLPETVSPASRARSLGDAFGVMWRAFARVLTHPRAMGYSLCIAAVQASMFAFVTDAAFAYIEYFGVSPSRFPLLFGANIVMIMAFHRLNIWLLRRHAPRRILPYGALLHLASTCALFGYVISFEPRLVFVVPLIMLSIGSLGLIVSNAFARYMSHFQGDTGTANAVNGTLRMSTAGAVGIALGALHDGTLLTMASGMAGCAVVATLIAWSLTLTK
jgi:DHA1 family bicyclomycin/chloramphenicol resistance-like MFS transporter